MPRRSFRTADAHTSASAPRLSRSTFGTVAKSSLCLSLLWQPPLEKGARRAELISRVGSHARLIGSGITVRKLERRSWSGL